MRCLEVEEGESKTATKVYIPRKRVHILRAAVGGDHMLCIIKRSINKNIIITGLTQGY